MKADKLVRMANQIAANFDYGGDKQKTVAGIADQQAEDFEVGGGIDDLELSHAVNVIRIAAGQLSLEGGGKAGGVVGIDAGYQQAFLAAELAEEGDLVDPGGLGDGAGGGLGVADLPEELHGSGDEALAGVFEGLVWSWLGIHE